MLPFFSRYFPPPHQGLHFYTGSPYSAHVRLAIVVFMAGEPLDAIARLDDSIATVRHNPICYMVQVRA